MRMIFLAILLCLADLSFATNYPPTYYIPAGGQTINTLAYFDVASQTFYVTTSGAVNLGGNAYTLTYASLPYANTTWRVIFDASQLTLASGTQVNLFGETPLSAYPGTKMFFIEFDVVIDAGVASKKVTYFPSYSQLVTGNLNTLTVTGASNFYGKIFDQGEFGHPFNPDSAGLVLKSDSSIARGCTSWCTVGNSGLSASTNFLGTTDNTNLVFKVNSQKSGIVDGTNGNTGLGYQSLNVNAGTVNTGIGFQALKANTSGINNTAVGAGAVIANSTGNNNTGVGEVSLTFCTTGTDNTALGYDALPATTTGAFNTAVGSMSGLSNVTGSNNTAIGYRSNYNTGAFSNSILLGANSFCLGSNRLDISPAVKVIGLTGHTTGIGYVLTDTSGNGDFSPQPIKGSITYYTPVTGDSVSISTRQNIVNPAGTIANFTPILPGSPYNGQVLEFSFTQAVTNILWSTAANQSNSVESHVPVAATAGKSFQIQYSSNLTKWVNF